MAFIVTLDQDWKAPVFIVFSQVAFVGNPAAAYRYLIAMGWLGRS
jgi:hypothetical protein